MKQTAVEWLMEQVKIKQDLTHSDVNKVKEMEKEQMIDFANYCVELQYESFKTGEDINVETMEELLEIFKK